jgi:hypothetical protein
VASSGGISSIYGNEKKHDLTHFFFFIDKFFYNVGNNVPYFSSTVLKLNISDATLQGPTQSPLNAA